MTIRFHPDDATLMGYAAGALSHPFTILVGAHAELCPECRRNLKLMNALGGAAMQATPAESLAEGAFERVVARLDTPCGAPDGSAGGRAPPTGADLPVPLARLVGGGLDALPWRRVLPRGEESLFTFSTRRGVHILRFLRADPGQEIPEHAHPGLEMTMVLQGSLRDGDRDYAAGDVGEIDDDRAHKPIAVGAQPCLCVIAEEGPPRFTSTEMRELPKRIGV